MSMKKESKRIFIFASSPFSLFKIFSTPKNKVHLFKKIGDKGEEVKAEDAQGGNKMSVILTNKKNEPILLPKSSTFFPAFLRLFFSFFFLKFDTSRREIEIYNPC